MQKNTNEIAKIFKLYTEAKNPVISKPPVNPIEQKVAPLVKSLNTSTDKEISNVTPDLYDVLQNTDSPVLNELEDTDIPQFNYKQLGIYLDLAYTSKQPLLIYGEPGLGKSAVVKQYCKDAAASKGKTFVVWNKDIKQETKQDMMQNPDNYFTLIDVRTAQLDPTDIMGIPTNVASDTPYLEMKQMKWIYFMSLPDSDGVLFLDEINQGSQQVLKALYEVVLDRSAGGTSFSDNWAIIGAGNLGFEHGNEPIPPALANRFTCGTLIADSDGWLEWAESVKLNPFIIGFVKSSPGENFYVKPKNPSDPFPSPRQMEKLSGVINNILLTYHQAKLSGKPIKEPIFNTIGNQAAGLCGVYWARKFVTFLKYIQNFNIQNILDNPDLKKEKADKLHALVSFLSNQVKNILPKIVDGKTQDAKAVQVMDALIHVTVSLNSEWRSIVWSSIMKLLNLDQKRELLTYIQTVEVDENVSKTLKSAFNQLGEILKGE